MKNTSALKYHMFFNIMYQINKPAQENMRNTFFLCAIHLEMKKELLSGNPPRYVSKLTENGVIEM